MTKQKQGKKTRKEEEHGACGAVLEDSFVIYDPDNPPFERLYLCQYLSELSDLEAEDDGKSH